ncbi:MAG: hypothetical protein M1834_006995 [Cirrosporium novae-zelandiae]|nr:MAG: hypothetical protein M1834_006995 [Cirrosporium novae-zelandiae]
MSSSFLDLENLHVFITGAAGGIGGEAANEFLRNGCKVTAHDIHPIATSTPSPNLFTVQGDVASEISL